MPHETNDGPRVGRTLNDGHASLAADYPTVLSTARPTAGRDPSPSGVLARRLPALPDGELAAAVEPAVGQAA